MITYELARTPQDLSGILSLQSANLPAHISEQELQKEGFVTVHHTLPLLEKMNHPHPHVIAKDGENVVGYTLVMLPQMAEEVPVLIPMFSQINQLKVGEKDMRNSPYFVMGQVCIAKGFRGQGIFTGLYQKLAACMKPYFEWCITEIASRNPRSLRAHEKVGFQELHTYTDATDEWVLVGLRLC